MRHPMIRSFLLILLTTVLFTPAFAADEAVSKPIEPEKISLGRPVSFEKDIRDILELNCVACHYDGGAESRLVVEDAATMIKGGKRGAGIVPGKPDESLIYLVAARKKTPHMPPLPNKVEAAALTPKELGLLRQWIIEGAQSDGTSTGTEVNWQPIPAGMNASYAVALSPWADSVAASRANQLSIFGINTGDEVKLVDPNLAAIKVGDQLMYPGGAAHRDFVHSVAFHPNGRMLASGGFRVVKLWEQPQNVQTLKSPLGAVAADIDINVAKQLAAIGTQQNTVTIRSLSDGKELKKLEGHTGPVSGVAISADGTQVFSGSADKTVKIWVLETGAVTRQFETPAPIHDLCLTLDGKQLVTAHEDNMIRVWNIAAPDPAPAEGEAEKPVLEIKGHSKPVRSIALVLPAGTQLVSGSDDNTARIWTLANGAAVRSLNHGGPVVSVAASPDGKYLASASPNNTAKLWEAASGKQIAELRGHLPSQRADLVAKEEADLAKQLVALGDKAQKAAEKNATERAEAVTKSNEAKVKADTAVADQTKKRDDSKGMADEGKKKLDAGTKVAADAQTTADEAKKVADASTTELATATAAQKAAVPIADAAMKALVAAQTAEKAAVAAKGTADKAAVDAQTKLDLASKAAEAAKAASEKDKDNAELTKQLADAQKAQTDAQAGLDAAQKAATAAAAILTDAQKATVTATAASTAAVKVLTDAEAALVAATEVKKKADVAKTQADANVVTQTAALKALTDAQKKLDDELKKQEDELKKQDEALKSATRSVDLAVKADAKAKTDSATATAAHTKSHEFQKAQDEAYTKAQEATKAAEKPLTAVAFSLDGKRLATSSDDGSITVWSGDAGLPLDVIKGEGGPARVLAFSSESLLIAAGDDQDAVVWDTNPAWELTAQLGAGADDPLNTAASPFEFRVLSLAFSPDGSRLATGGGEPSRSGEVMIWDVAKRELIREIEDAHSDTVFGIEFSRDGKQIVSGAADKFVKIHDVETGKHVRSFEGHTHHVMGVSWQADGSTLVSAGADNAIKVWNVETGEQIRTIAGYTKQVTSIRFAGIGGIVISSGGDKTVRQFTASNGGAVRSFSGGTDFMYSSDASRDGKLVVASGEDGVIRVWNGTNGQVIRNFEPPAAAEKTQASIGK
jgi:WD40 repeat protein